MRISPILIKGSPIFLVGEASGKTEEEKGVPFVGASGQELDSMLQAAGIERKACSISNVFLDRPKDNNLENWLVPKKFGAGIEFQKGKYFSPEKDKERLRLYAEIEEVRPNIVVALGNTACWALLGKTGINALRGTVSRSGYVTPKIIATMHPAAIMRQYDMRPTAIADLIKAAYESSFSEIRIPHAKLLISPTLLDIEKSLDFLLSATLLSYDIETRNEQITCISFATNQFSICIPFVLESGANFWPSLKDELQAWGFVKIILESSIPKVTQNGLYDIQYLIKYGIKPRKSLDDTMLLHHSIQPEMPKSLGFLASVYTNFPSWKNMRKSTSNKKEE